MNRDGTTSPRLADLLLAAGCPRTDRELRVAAKLLASMLAEARLDKPRQFALLDAVRTAMVRRWLAAGRSRGQAEADIDMMMSYVRQRMAR
jgi:hypothetical protein